MGMVMEHRRSSGNRFHHGDIEGFSKGNQFRDCSGIKHSASGDDQGFLGIPQNGRGLGNAVAVRTGPWNLMNCFFKKDFGIIKGFCLDILR